MADHVHWCLGVDGGGTKTLAWLSPTVGENVKPLEGTAGPSNPRAVGLATAIEQIDLAIRRVRQAAELDDGPIDAICIAVAGGDREDTRRAIEAWANAASLARMVKICNDAEPIVACLPNRVGVALIAGTGSFAYAKSSDGNTARAGGWGYRFGDEGSGYAIAVAGVSAAMRYADGRGPATSLLECWLEYFGLVEPRSLIERLYAPGFDRQAIAKLAPFVLEQAEQGDQIARQICRHAAAELAALVLAVQRRLSLSEQALPLAMTGGVLLNSTELREELSQCLKSHGLTTSSKLVPHPVAGAVQIARFAAAGTDFGIEA